MKIFNLAEELEKERKKNKELEKEINRLTAESTHYESKYYNEAKKVDKATEIIKKYGYEKQMEEDYLMNRVNLANYNCLLLDILKGEE